MNKHVLLTLLSIFLMACSSNIPAENKNLIPISQYLDLTTKDGKKVPVNKQRFLFSKYWKIKPLKMPLPRNRSKKVQSGCVQLLVAVSEEGKMSSYAILKSYPEGVFDEDVITSFKARSWQAVKENIDKTPVLTTMQLNIIHSGSANRGEATKECGIRR